MEWKLSDLYGIDLPHVSSIPGVKLTRLKDYHKYHIDITAFTEESRKSIVEDLHLDAMQGSPQHPRLKSNLRYTVIVFSDLVNMSLWQKRPCEIF